MFDKTSTRVKEKIINDGAKLIVFGNFIIPRKGCLRWKQYCENFGKMRERGNGVLEFWSGRMK